MIPKVVRDLRGIAPADKKRLASRFQKLRGHAGAGLDTEAIMALTRGEA